MNLMVIRYLMFMNLVGKKVLDVDDPELSISIDLDAL